MTNREKKLTLLLILIVVGAAIYFLVKYDILLIDVKDGTNLLVAFGTIGMTSIIVYIEVIRPWIQKPEIKIEFANEPPYCRHAILEGTEKKQYYVRIRVNNQGKSVAKGLRGKLVDAICKNGKSHEDFDPVYLHWTTIEPLRARERLEYQLSPRYLQPVDLNRGEWDYLDVFCTEEGREDRIEIVTTKTARACLKYFHVTDKIEYAKITIYGENVKPRTEAYKLVWSGEKYDEIRMTATN